MKSSLKIAVALIGPVASVACSDNMSVDDREKIAEIEENCLTTMPQIVSSRDSVPKSEVLKLGEGNSQWELLVEAGYLSAPP
jgi:hypothetical protein